MTTKSDAMATTPESLGVLDDPDVTQVTKEDALDRPHVTFEPVRIDCPVCERTGTTTNGVNVCGGCGAWFAVEPDGGNG